MDFFKRLTHRRGQQERERLRTVDDIARAIAAGEEPEDVDNVLAILAAAGLTEATLADRVEIMRERKRLQDAIASEDQLREELAGVEDEYAAEKAIADAAQAHFKKRGDELWDRKSTIENKLHQIEAHKHKLRNLADEDAAAKRDAVAGDLSSLGSRRKELMEQLRDGQLISGTSKLTLQARERQTQGLLMKAEHKHASPHERSLRPTYLRELKQIAAEREAAEKELAEIERQIERLKDQHAKADAAALVA